MLGSLPQGERDDFDQLLWKASGVDALVKEVKGFKDLPAALQGEISFRVCRMNGLLQVFFSFLRESDRDHETQRA